MNWYKTSLTKIAYCKADVIIGEPFEFKGQPAISIQKNLYNQENPQVITMTLEQVQKELNKNLQERQGISETAYLRCIDESIATYGKALKMLQNFQMQLQQ